MEQIIETAFAYSSHTLTCQKCGAEGKELCAEGLVLLKKFHDALNADMNRQAREREN